MPQAGIDPLRQNHATYEASPLPGSCLAYVMSFYVHTLAVLSNLALHAIIKNVQILVKV